MINEESLNTLINQVIYSLDHLLKDKHYSQDILDYLYLITTGMIILYGDDLVDDIYDTILDTKIIKKPEYMVNSPTTLDYYINPIYNNYLFKNIKSRNYIDYGILFNKIDNSFIKTLEYMTYLFNNLLFHRHDKVSIKEHLYLQFEHIFHGNTINMQKKDTLKTLDKVILLLQSEDIIKVLLNLRIFKIKNKKFRKCLDNLNNINVDLYKIEGLDSLVTLFRPIYNDKKVKELINSYEGMLSFEKQYDLILGKNAFYNLVNNVEILDKLINEDNINGNYYKYAEKYLELRNNFINKYILLVNH